MSNEQQIFSPPTPRSATNEDYGRITTRSRRTVAPSRSPRRKNSSPRPKAIPKSRKLKAGKREKATTPELTAPLSVLTVELHHIPVKDMEAWVNRSAEVRQDEVDKRGGYITRPMNSFMLYRSAYAERAKAWCAQNNHQIVSSVAGGSWPLEPPGIRELYHEYAKIERMNHANAHPKYKFSPSKAVALARKRKRDWSDGEEPSDLEDAEWAPRTKRPRNRSIRMIERSVSFPSNGMDGDFFGRSFGPNGHGMNKSSWDMTNEGRPMPMPMHNDLYSQYYQTAVYPEMMEDAFQNDMRMRKVGAPAPSIQFSSNHAILGLPGGNAGDLMQQLEVHPGTAFGEGQLDPMLMAYDGNHHSGIDPTTLHHDFRNNHLGMGQHDIDSLLEMKPTQLDLCASAWQSDPNMVTLEQESEFEKWIGEH
ncbi:hypothetical protein GQ44DRAFT_809227 [Phaeosphaeriaceae sp. PMI808]|nr:hypothetical protein GQ44DRAFT_809227 [Phaeosphaeriaceae sp. PMI808]